MGANARWLVVNSQYHSACMRVNSEHLNRTYQTCENVVVIITYYIDHSVVFVRCINISSAREQDQQLLADRSVASVIVIIN